MQKTRQKWSCSLGQQQQQHEDVLATADRQQRLLLQASASNFVAPPDLSALTAEPKCGSSVIGVEVNGNPWSSWAWDDGSASLRVTALGSLKGTKTVCLELDPVGGGDATCGRQRRFCRDDLGEGLCMALVYNSNSANTASCCPLSRLSYRPTATGPATTFPTATFAATTLAATTTATVAAAAQPTTAQPGAPQPLATKPGASPAFAATAQPSIAAATLTAATIARAVAAASVAPAVAAATIARTVATATITPAVAAATIAPAIAAATIARAPPSPQPSPQPPSPEPVPRSMATSFGSTYMASLINVKTPARYQMVFSHALVNMSVGTVIQGVSVRLAGNANTDLPFPSATAVFKTLQIFMGIAANAPDAMVKSFDKNYVTSSRMLVLRGPWMVKPKDFRGGLGAWYWIRFQFPYRYNGGNLVLEIQHTGPSVGLRPIPFDARPADALSAASYAPSNVADVAMGPANRPVLAIQFSY
ncbi:hypothetical protein TSOC_000577 [Tetrabaena socialis]|uniref:Pherophorin domain-containing protein n=1 Tax=Tetrabaena socialis TaxID=47790 RepID=A0A2J8AIX9_9CHLO|nr:hypothetical protein TSOC_000577 [Tetrabaena socialis]|eukprot:PNH12470.1 hypothetical protein TSOC_000577 [Tetrabaena socialis]